MGRDGDDEGWVTGLIDNSTTMHMKHTTLASQLKGFVSPKKPCISFGQHFGQQPPQVAYVTMGCTSPATTRCSTQTNNVHQDNHILFHTHTCPSHTASSSLHRQERWQQHSPMLFLRPQQLQGCVGCCTSSSILVLGLLKTLHIIPILVDLHCKVLPCSNIILHINVWIAVNHKHRDVVEVFLQGWVVVALCFF